MATEKLDLETLSIDEMLDLKDALESKLTEIAKTEAALMTERLARLKTYLPEETPAPKPAAKSVRSKTPRRKRAKAAPKPKAKPAATPKLKATSISQSEAITTKTAKSKSTRKTIKQTKIRPKFRDPETGKTWSGRGMAPVWLRDYETAGRKRTEFEI